MGQFKPLPKMETTEPSVELKLKKGGRVKKADGGAMPMVAPRAPMTGNRPMMPQPATMVGRRMPPRMAAPAAPMRPAMPAMKKGGMAEGGMADTAQDKAMIKKAFKQHDSQEHKGGKGTELKLKKGGKMATGGVANSNAGGYATGGVAKGNAGGYKDGGHMSFKSGISKHSYGHKAGGGMAKC